MVRYFGPFGIPATGIGLDYCEERGEFRLV